MRERRAGECTGEGGCRVGVNCEVVWMLEVGGWGNVWVWSLPGDLEKEGMYG